MRVGARNGGAQAGAAGAAVVLGAALAAAPAAAQRARLDPLGGASGAPLGAVLLRLRPRVGDTVRTRFEQTVQLFARDPDGGDRGAGMGSSMVVLGHSVVERVDARGAVIVAVTDSVALTARGAPPKATEAARRAMQGRRSRVRVGFDGATTVLGGGGGPRADADAPDDASATRFPAVLPSQAVAPGAIWQRAVTVPWGAPRGPRTPAPGSTVDVWFRFDSLARGRAVAHLSLRGTVRPPGGRETAAGLPDASSVGGAIAVDLERGWVVDSRTRFQLDGVISAPGAAPRPARVVVTQRLRVL